MKKFITNFRNFINESSVRKQVSGQETLFIFTEKQFIEFDQYCRSQFGFSLEDSPYAEPLIQEPENLPAVAEAAADDPVDNEEWPWTADDDRSSDKVVSLQKKRMKKAKDTRPHYTRYLDKKRMVDLPASYLEEKGWVIKVPTEVLESLEEILLRAAEVSEVFTSGVYADAKNWYHILNDLCSYPKGVPLKKEDEGLFALLLAVFSPMTAFQTNFREAVLGYKAILVDIEAGRTQELYEYVDIGTVKGNTDAVALRDQFPKLASAHYWAEISLFGGAKWNNYCRIVKSYIEKDGLPMSEASEMVQQDLRWIRTYKVNKLGLDTKNREFIGRTKIANFALNILDPRIAERDEDFVVNVTIDTWMTRAFYPGIGISKEILNDPHSYYYLVKHVVDMAKKLDMLPHEVQAIIWVHLLKEDKANVAATASEMSNLFTGAVKEEMEQIAVLGEEKPDDGFSTLLNAADQMIKRFNTLEDFVNVRTIVGLPSERGEPENQEATEED